MSYLGARRGDYGRYRGDPGLFGFIGKVAKGALGLAGKVLPGPIGMVARYAGGLIPSRAAPTVTRMAMPRMQQAMPGGTPIGGFKGFMQRAVPGGATGFYPKRRRMNPGNAKALRRAIRRTDAFVKLARRSLKGTGYTISRRTSARRPAINIRERGPGGVTVER